MSWWGFPISSDPERFMGMDISGPAPIAIVHRHDESDLVLRMNQRIAAEVVQVSGDRVVLSVNGVQIVARLTSSEQAAQLIERRMSQFVVKDASSSIITLQLLPQAANLQNLTTQQIDNLIAALLQQAGLPVNGSNIILARAVLEHGLPVDASIINQLNHTLEQVPAWGEKEAQMAVFFIAEGLNLSPQAIQYFVQQFPDIGKVIQELLSDLRKYIMANQGNQNVELAQASLAFIKSFLVDLTEPQTNLIHQLEWIIKIYRQTIEHALAEIIKNPALKFNNQLDQGLITLLTFYNQARAENVSSRIVQNIEEFLDTLRFIQFLNIQSEPNNPKSLWFHLNIPLNTNVNIPPAANQRSPSQASIRIAYLPDEAPLRIEAKHTRFIVQVELELGILEVDVSLAHQKVGVNVRANDVTLLEKAKEEISALTAGINAMGYQVQTARCEMAEMVKFNGFGEGGSKNWGEVRLGV